MNFINKFYVWSTGYSFTNLGRLFIRLFVGILMIHFALKQLSCGNDHCSVLFGCMPQLGSTELTVLIYIELICSLFIMAGFLMRIMIIPLFVIMAYIEYHLHFCTIGMDEMFPMMTQPGLIPLMFMGIYFFLLLVGPGKISIDYFLSLNILHRANRSESDLEEV